MIATQVSRPIRSASASGPSGCAKPSFAIVSIASASATPSCSAQTASLMNGIKIRFETKPGKSFATAGVLPSSRASSVIACAVSSEVSLPRTTSTSFSTGTGLKKCMPITLSGRPVAAASELIGIDDVFEASTASGGSTASARRKTSSFTAASSTTASTIRSPGTRSSTGSTRASTSSGSRPPFSASFVRLLRIVSTPCSTAPGAASYRETRRPEAAITCAIPPPIWPAPTTSTCSNLTSDFQQKRVALATAGADRGEAQAAAVAAQLVDHRPDDPPAARADRVPERDRPAVHVHVRLVGAEQLRRVPGDRGERLVDLDALHVVDRLPCALERDRRSEERRVGKECRPHRAREQ